jgi:hypothetical protein
VTRHLLVILAAALLAGCGAEQPPPEVGFAAGDARVTARPTQYCNLEFTDCRNDDGAPVELAVPAGTPVEISVPEEIASTPWHVVYRYRDAAGQQIDERSSVFTPGQRDSYLLELPDPRGRLLTAQVQQFGPPPQAAVGSGDIEFPIRASWVLLAVP